MATCVVSGCTLLFELEGVSGYELADESDEAGYWGVGSECVTGGVDTADPLEPVGIRTRSSPESIELFEFELDERGELEVVPVAGDCMPRVSVRAESFRAGAGRAEVRCARDADASAS